jgi:site-specific recombinase XerD
MQHPSPPTTEIVIAAPVALVSSRPPVGASGAALSIEQTITAWLHAKSARSQSAETFRSYEATILQFRNMLLASGLDLDGEPTGVEIVASGFAALANAKSGSPPSAATSNKRLAVVSSYYKFVIKKRYLPGVNENPIERVEKRPTGDYDSARALAPEFIKERLAAIDCSTVEGARDYCLLLTALTTGRRVAEIAGLRYGDLTCVPGGKRIELHFKRVKGGRTKDDQLAATLYFEGVSALCKLCLLANRFSY